MKAQYTIFQIILDLLDSNNSFQRCKEFANKVAPYHVMGRSALIKRVLTKKRLYAEFDDDDSYWEGRLYIKVKSWLKAKVETLQERLASGQYTAKGVPKGSSQLEVIPPTLWVSLKIDVLASSAATKNGSHAFSGIVVSAMASASPITALDTGNFESLEERHEPKKRGAKPKDFDAVWEKYEERVSLGIAIKSALGEAKFLADFAMRSGVREPPSIETLRKKIAERRR